MEKQDGKEDVDDLVTCMQYRSERKCGTKKFEKARLGKTIWIRKREKAYGWDMQGAAMKS